MNTLNDSVIICDTPPKSARNKVSLSTKRIQKNSRKTFYESPLKHIQLSSKRWKQRQAEQKLMSNAEQITSNQKNSFLPVKDLSFQDSIIILSDNESELNNQDDQNDCAKRTKKRKRPLETLTKDKQSSQCINNSDKSLCQIKNEKEKCKKRRKINSPVLSSDNNSYCNLVSDTEDSEIIAVDLDNENIAPASSSAHQTSDDVIVVWSSKKPSLLSTNYSEREKTIAEEENDKIFMIDNNPNPENLSYLECNKESSHNKCEKNTEKSTKTTTEKDTKITTEKSTEQNNSDDEISKELPFSNQGLRLPKAHNISKSIVIKKAKRTNTFLNYRRSVSRSLITLVPTVHMQRTVDAVRFESAFKPSSSESSRFEPSTSELSRLEPSTYEVSRLEPSTYEASRLEPSTYEVSRLEPSTYEASRLEPSTYEASRLEPSTYEASRLEPSTYEVSRLEPSTYEVSRPEPSTYEASRLEPSTYEVSRPEPSTYEFPAVEPPRSEQPGRLREIIIDGNNVAMAHKNNNRFSEEGIVLVTDYFRRRGHTVKIFIPQYRRAPFRTSLEKLYTEGIVVFTPSRRVGGKRITPYDDRFILEYATVSGGIVISLDQYRDLYREKPEWRDTIEKRLLAPTFVGDYVMFPEDPLGRNGPSLDEFLRY